MFIRELVNIEMLDYQKRLAEVDEILKHFPKEVLSKIPMEEREIIKKNKDKNYRWKYDENKELKDQNLNRDTIIILSYLNMKYLLNPEQRDLMQQIFEFNERKNKK